MSPRLVAVSTEGERPPQGPPLTAREDCLVIEFEVGGDDAAAVTLMRAVLMVCAQAMASEALHVAKGMFAVAVQADGRLRAETMAQLACRWEWNFAPEHESAAKTCVIRVGDALARRREGGAA